MAVYATSTDLGRLSALSAANIAAMLTATVDAALVAASADADGYLAARFPLPLVTWGDDVRQRVCDIAAYRLASNGGYNPEGSAEDLRDRYDDAWRWLRDVAAGLVTPSATSASPAASAVPRVSTATPRGW